MAINLTHERKRKWFVWGTVLTCTLSIPLIGGLSNIFRSISAEKATGLAAVAGGLAEAYVTFGAILAFALPITAIFLLSRSFVRGHAARSLFSLLCICWNAVMLALAGLFLWFYFLYLPRAAAHSNQTATPRDQKFDAARLSVTKKTTLILTATSARFQ